jgi:hypothetical protein
VAPAKLDRAIELAVRWLDERRHGFVLRTVAGLIVLGVPAAQNFKLIEDRGWLGLFFASAILLVPLTHYHQGAPASRLARRLAEINGTFAGTIELLRTKLLLANGRKLQNEQCEMLCVALLHLIRDYTALALQVGERPTLRATLAVPVASSPGGPVDAVRVWCYDRPPEARGHTRIPLEKDGMPVPGSPAAYLLGRMQVITDLHELPPAQLGKKAPYRSILSIPLSARGNDGRPLAVVNLDADVPGFFKPEEVVARVWPFISPALNTLGLVLTMRKGGDYVFPQ